MNDWKVIFATVVIFGTGVITGGLLVNHVDHYHPHAAVARKAPPANGTNAAANAQNNPIIRQSEILNKPAFLAYLDNQLTEAKFPLSVEQHKAIEKLIADGQGQMRKVTQDVDRGIREVLDQEQRKKYDEMRKASHPNKPVKAGGTNSPALTNAPVPAPVSTNLSTNLPPAATNAPAN